MYFIVWFNSSFYWVVDFMFIKWKEIMEKYYLFFGFGRLGSLLFLKGFGIFGGFRGSFVLGRFGILGRFFILVGLGGFIFFRCFF